MLGVDGPWAEVTVGKSSFAVPWLTWVEVVGALSLLFTRWALRNPEAYEEWKKQATKGDGPGGRELWTP